MIQTIDSEPQLPIRNRIERLTKVYGIGTAQESKTLPGVLGISSSESQDWQDLLTLASAQKQTWFVITLGCFGRGANLTEAATNCLKAGASKSDRASVQLIVGDDDARFHSIFSIEFKQAATSIFVGAFPNLGCLVRTKQPKETKPSESKNT